MEGGGLCLFMEAIYPVTDEGNERCWEEASAGVEMSIKGVYSLPLLY